jgi:RHH-type proline utilization regulon transcriptional repressor/proline dehydrogenase/delta 1-pyrroline-5-carboxylate dehydrogenase
LEPGESWLVAPEFVDKQKYILKPTVKWGVKPSGFTFKNELFAPLLSVVCIDDLEQGIEFANSSEYGLTAGLQSLNVEEHQVWRNRIEAGNLYINRGITGAIVRRQPFGGMKRSAFGGGTKAGGPNHVSCFVEPTENELPLVAVKNSFSDLLSDEKEKNKLNFAADSLKKYYESVFSKEIDVSNLHGEENIFRYLPLKNIGFCIQADDALVDALIVLLAADRSKTPLIVSISADDSKLKAIESAAQNLANVQIKTQSVDTFIAEMDIYERVRTCSAELSDAFYTKAAELGKHIATNKPLAEGRLEMLHYLKEQSISYEYHRYGSIFGEKV